MLVTKIFHKGKLLICYCIKSYVVLNYEFSFVGTIRKPTDVVPIHWVVLVNFHVKQRCSNSCYHELFISFADCCYNDASPFYPYIYIQVPVRVAGGLLFELLGQSAGDPFKEEDDIPIVLRSWHAQRFLVTALHVKGSASNINVLGIAEVQVCSCLIKECYVLGLANVNLGPPGQYDTWTWIQILLYYSFILTDPN